MRNLLTVYCILISTITFAQQDILSNSWTQFSRDSITNSRLETSINTFLTEANKGNFNTKHLDSIHYKKYEYFFQQFDEYANNSYFKDSLFFKPYLLKSYSYDKKDFYITIQLAGTNEGKTMVKSILEFKAIPKADYYEFKCLFKENTSHWKKEQQDDVTFHYLDSYDAEKARKFVNFNKKLEKLTGKPSPIENYYKCEDTHEALAIFGIKHSFRRTNSDYGFGLSDGYGNFITGVNSEDYLHDHVHSFFGKIYDSDETWREFEEGIAIYYGDNWGVPMQELVNVMKNIAKENPKFDFLEELKKGRKSKRYDGKHLYDRILTSILAKEIIEKKGFDAAIELLHCGDNGERFFELLNQKIGINERNFNRKIVKLMQ